MTEFGNRDEKPDLNTKIKLTYLDGSFEIIYFNSSIGWPINGVIAWRNISELYKPIDNALRALDELEKKMRKETVSGYSNEKADEI